MTTIGSRQSVKIDSFEFSIGYVEGLNNSQALPRFDLRGAATEEVIVGIVRNMCEMWKDGVFEDKVLEELLLHDSGLIAGFVTRGLLPG